MISKKIETVYPVQSAFSSEEDAFTALSTSALLAKSSVPYSHRRVADNYVIINPKIVSTSQEKIYVEDGEGCLSINREIDGIVPRSARVTVEAYDEEGNKIRIRAREELAIVFQHEIDHLNGILFFDHIDPKNPFKGQNQYRAI